jgi:hypothetical protein
VINAVYRQRSDAIFKGRLTTSSIFLRLNDSSAADQFERLDKGFHPRQNGARSTLTKNFLHTENARSDAFKENCLDRCRGQKREQIILRCAPSVCTLQSLSTRTSPSITVAFMALSESMGNHDSKIMGADSIN